MNLYNNNRQGLPTRFTGNRCTIILVLLLSGPAPGQDAAGIEADDEEVIEEIRVTGSRIKRSNFDSPAPLMVFNSRQMVDAGITTLGEFSRYLPQNAESKSDSQQNGSSLFGSAAFNLRGVGLDATLTLVNGRRVAPFASVGDESPFVDINAIPLAAIDRIEVLKDGASAIYGSEAVAGVVNIITRKDIDQVTVEGSYMTTSEGDGDEWDVSISGGWNAASTSLSGTLSYFSRERLYNRDRAWSSDLDLRDQGGRNSRSGLSSPPTAFLLSSGGLLADPECPENSPINSIDVRVPGVDEVCRFNWAWFTTMQQPSDRIGLSTFFEHELVSGTTLFAELLYGKNETRMVLAPTPYNNISATASHPNNPFGEDVLLFGRVLDAGERGFEKDLVNWRMLAGLRGEIKDWEWEIAAMATESESDDTRFNAILAKQFQDAIDGLGGSTGDQFYNPFGLNTQNGQDVIDQFLSSGTGVVITTGELTLDGQITGDIWDLPGGSVGAAFGFQARSQDLEQLADDAELTGAYLGGGGLSPIDADRDIYSAFAELLVPLHTDLEAQLAVRYDDYSDFGSTTNPKVGLGWRPLDEILLRVTWGTSFRPPTFRELYDPAVTAFALLGEDPHRCPITDDVFDCVGDVVATEFSGNPELQPDEGETLLFGVAWRPSFAPGLELDVDFWQIEHKNRILNSSDSFLSDLFLEEMDPFLNPFTIRAPQSPEDIALGIPGPIVSLRDTYVNGDTLDVDGIDFDLKYAWSTSRAGDFESSMAYTYLHDYVFGTDLAGFVFEDDWAGTYGFAGGLPTDRGNVRISWKKNQHGASGLISYAGEFESFRTLHVDGVNTGEPFSISDYTQLDLQYSYVFESLGDGMLRVGCRNCTDEDPPIYNHSVNSEPFHEGRGLMFYVRWSQPL